MLKPAVESLDSDNLDTSTPTDNLRKDTKTIHLQFFSHQLKHKFSISLDYTQLVDHIRNLTIQVTEKVLWLEAKKNLI